MTRTSRLVLDSWAWLELFAGSAKGKRVEDEISGSAECYTTAVSLAEVTSVISRRGMPTDQAISTVRSNSKVLPPDMDDAIAAGKLHADVKPKVPNFSLADAFALQAARKMGAVVLTGDPDFRGLKEARSI